MEEALAAIRQLYQRRWRNDISPGATDSPQDRADLSREATAAVGSAFNTLTET